MNSLFNTLETNRPKMTTAVGRIFFTAVLGIRCSGNSDDLRKGKDVIVEVMKKYKDQLTHSAPGGC
jgi:methyl coenzyme M reductase alpha subunit